MTGRRGVTPRRRHRSRKKNGPAGHLHDAAPAGPLPLQQSVDDLEKPSNDDFYGAGRVNALRAVLQ